ncbi:ABC transporter permease subunit [Exiguobacterium sp.]|uniref:ABC transporter permease subunit n=1 Tax=Exiguobacterium sp. TaxID=44751 RepID=UPI0028AB2172|nr:ABC transporter permease subunit [Exiguobacterium sp.]
MLLIRSLFKQVRKPVLAYSIGTSLYLLMLALLYPSMMKTGLLEAKLEALPPEVLKAFQYDKVTGFNNVLDLLGGNYYGLIFQVIASLFLLSLTARLVARPIDNGELIVYLAAPITRNDYTLAVASVIGLASLLLVTLNGLVLMVADWWMSGITIDTMVLWRIQLNALMLLFAIGTFTLFIATLFDEERRAFSLAGSVLVLSIVLTILSELSDKTEWLRYLSVFSLFNTTQLLEGTNHFLLHSVILFVLFLIFLTGAFVQFGRRSLSI